MPRNFLIAITGPSSPSSYAALGMPVVIIDARGTTFRSRAFAHAMVSVIIEQDVTSRGEYQGVLENRFGIHLAAALLERLWEGVRARHLAWQATA